MPPRRRKRGRIKPGIRVEVIGDEISHLKNANEFFQKHLQKILFDDAIQPTADFVEMMGKALAPRKTGHLMSTIRQKARKSKRKVTIRIGPDHTKFKKPGAFYAAFQEFGVKGLFPAVRYMRRARLAAVPILQRLLEKATNKAIRTYVPPPVMERPEKIAS